MAVLRDVQLAVVRHQGRTGGIALGAASAITWETRDERLDGSRVVGVERLTRRDAP